MCESSETVKPIELIRRKFALHINETTTTHDVDKLTELRQGNQRGCLIID
jgi:hypothetical protein